ncbi:MAG: AzlC family ABC transporter permease [Nocardioidaceae bacterium]
MSSTPIEPAPVAASREQAREVFTLVAPVCFGMAPLGLAFGLLVVNAGLAWWWAPVFTIVLFAGSLEFLLIPLAVAGAPLTVVALTAAVVNSRHVFFTLSFPLQRVRGLFARAYSTFALTDEAYALSAHPSARSWGSVQILLLQALLHASWVLPATAGALLGAALPLDQIYGLNFALVALFIVLAVDAYRARPDRVTLATGGLCVLLAWLLLPGQLLPAAFAAFTGVLVVRSRCAGTSQETADA